jgi:CAAX protease family protein
MQDSSTPRASGIQVAFLIFAVALLAAPVGIWLAKYALGNPEHEAAAGRVAMFAATILILVSFPLLRAKCREMLATPIRPADRSEVAVLCIVIIAGNFAMGGATAVWLWLQGGDELLASRMQIRSDAELARALTPAVLLMLPLAWLIGPIVEELVFRGFLYRAWAARWHWAIALLLTAIVFALYHRSFASAFTASILFTCVFRRTGSLRAAIVVHAVGNVSLWYPLLGRFVLPSDAGAAITHFSTWWFHFTCLAFMVVFLPVYAWMSRNK